MRETINPWAQDTMPTLAGADKTTRSRTQQGNAPARSGFIGPIVLVLVILSLVMLIGKLPLSPLTGATVRTDTGYDFVIEEQFDSSTIINVGLQHTPRSLAISADVDGGGAAMVYLLTNTGTKTVLAINGDGSNPTERHRSVRYACQDTCAGLELPDNTVQLQLIVSGATLTIHNISYTTAMAPTGASIVDDGNRETDALSHVVYDWIQLALTVLAVILLVLGPIRLQGHSGHPVSATAVGIIAIVTSVTLMALMDAFNHYYLPAILLGVTLAVTFVLDLMLFREKYPAPYVPHDLPLFRRDSVQPDIREIREQFERVRRRLRR